MGPEEAPVALRTWDTATGRATDGARLADWVANATHAVPTCDPEALARAQDALAWALGNHSFDDAVAAVGDAGWLNCTAALLARVELADDTGNVSDTACHHGETCCPARNRTRLDEVPTAVAACGGDFVPALALALRDRGCRVLPEIFDRPSVNVTLCDQHAAGTRACHAHADCFTRCVRGRCEAPVGTGDAVWVRCALRQVRPDVLALLAARWAIALEDEVGWLEHLLARAGEARCTDGGTNETACAGNVTCNAPPCDGSHFCGACDGDLCRPTGAPARCVFPTTSGAACTARGGTETAEGCVVPPAECFADCAPVLPCTGSGQWAHVDLPHRAVEWREGGAGCAPNATLVNGTELLALSCARDACVDRWRTALNCSRTPRASEPAAALTGGLGLDAGVLAVAERWNWTGAELELWLTWTTALPDVGLQGALAVNLTFNGVAQAVRLSPALETCLVNCAYEFVVRWPALCSERTVALSYRWQLGARSGVRTGTLRGAECAGHTAWRNGRCEKLDTLDCAASPGFVLIPARTWQPPVRATEATCRTCGLDVDCAGRVGCDRTCGYCRGPTLRCVHANATACATLGTWDGAQCQVPFGRPGDCAFDLETCVGRPQSTCEALAGCNWTQVPCATPAECEREGECTDWEVEGACVEAGPCPGLGCISLLAPCPGTVLQRAPNASACAARKGCAGAIGFDAATCTGCGGAWHSLYAWVPGRWGPLREQALEWRPRAALPTARWGVRLDRERARAQFDGEAMAVARRDDGLRCALAPWSHALAQFATACLGAPARAPEPLLDVWLPCGERARGGAYEARARCSGAPVRVTLSAHVASASPGRRLLSVGCVEVVNGDGEGVGVLTGGCVDVVLSDPVDSLTLCLLPGTPDARFSVAALARDGVAVAVANASDTQLCGTVPGVSGRYCPAAVWSTNLSVPYPCPTAAPEAVVATGCAAEPGWAFWVRLAGVGCLSASLWAFVWCMRGKPTAVRFRTGRLALCSGGLAGAALLLSALGGWAELALYATAAALFALGLVPDLCRGPLRLRVCFFAGWAALVAGLLVEATRRSWDAWTVSAVVQIGVAAAAVLLLTLGVCRPTKMRALGAVYVAGTLAVWLVVVRRAPCE